MSLVFAILRIIVSDSAAAIAIAQQRDRIEQNYLRLHSIVSNVWRETELPTDRSFQPFVAPQCVSDVTLRHTRGFT